MEAKLPNLTLERRFTVQGTWVQISNTDTTSSSFMNLKVGSYVPFS